METYFENVGKPDIRAITETRYRIGTTGYWLWIAGYVLLVAYYAWCVVSGFGYLGVLLLFFCMLAYLLLTPYMHARKTMKRQRKANPGDLSDVTIQFGENIHLQSVNSTRTWEYHNLEKVYSLKYCYCLRFVDKSGFMISRDGFTKGTFAEFKQFLRTKRPDLKIPE